MKPKRLGTAREKGGQAEEWTTPPRERKQKLAAKVRGECPYTEMPPCKRGKKNGEGKKHAVRELL